MGKITIKEIAADLNLSIAAVSTALGSRSTSKVSAETEARVRAFAEKMNYRPSLAGKAMRSKQLRQVAILIDSDFDPRYRRLPVMDMPAIFGLNEYLRDRERQLNIIQDSGRRSTETPLPRYLREHIIDGLVVISTSAERDEVLGRDFERFSIPAIFLNAAGEYNCISIDDRAGASMATRHLIDLGHRNILYVGPPSGHCSISERQSGYKAAMETEGLDGTVYLLEEGAVEERLVYEQRIASNLGAGHRFMEDSYLKQRPTGIVCYDDRVALIVQKALHDAGFTVPGDVSLVGFNDMPFMDMLSTPLTTVRSDFYEMGQLAGRLLLDLIENQEVRVPSPIIKPELIVRQSSRPPVS